MKVDMSAGGITLRLKEMDELWLLSMKLVSAGRSLPKPRTKPAKQALKIFDSIRQVLIRDWDPIGIGDETAITDEYDAYIAPVYRILAGSRADDDLIACLRRIERDELGIDRSDPDRLKSVVKELFALDVHLSQNQ
jgi:hypothetical protein